jgi:VanZ family protein
MLQQLLLGARFGRWRLALAAMVYLAMVIGGSIPGVRADMAQVASGVILHASAYSGLCFLLFTGRAGSRTQRAVWAVLGVMALGAIDEYVQSFFPYRRAALMDWLVDCSAALVAALLLWSCWPRLTALQAGKRPA